MREVIKPQSGGSIPGDPQTTPKWRWHERVSYTFQPRWLRVITMEGMTLQMLRLLHGLIVHLGWDNQVTESLRGVGRAIGMHRNTVSRCLVRLEAARLIAVDRRNPTLLRITVSPYLVWQGRPHTLYKARTAFDERCRQAQDRHACLGTGPAARAARGGHAAQAEALHSAPGSGAATGRATPAPVVSQKLAHLPPGLPPDE